MQVGDVCTLRYTNRNIWWGLACCMAVILSSALPSWDGVHNTEIALKYVQLLRLVLNYFVISRFSKDIYEIFE